MSWLDKKFNQNKLYFSIINRETTSLNGLEAKEVSGFGKTHHCSELEQLEGSYSDQTLFQKIISVCRLKGNIEEIQLEKWPENGPSDTVKILKP